MNVRIERVDDPAACFAIRHQVFVVEQGVAPELELDALDKTAVHLLARDGHEPLGTARVLFDGGIAKIGRVCVLQKARGTGLGAALIRGAIREARTKAEITQVKLGAQVDALGFYEKLGFRAVGPVFLDAGIDHRTMVMTLA